MLNALAHYFLPRKSNNHKAKLIHTQSLFIITLLVILSQGIFGLINPSKGQVLGYKANISPSEVIRLTNIKRAENNLPPVVENSSLDGAALAKGNDMLAKGYWAHVAPDGTQPWAFFVGVHYDYRYAGENLARDFSDASSAVDAWMASPSHRENLLSPNYKDIGIGVVEGQLAGADTTVIVQFFGTKMGDTLPAQPVAESSPVALPNPTPTFAPVLAEINPSPVPTFHPALVASSNVTEFDFTRYLSLSLVGILILVVAVDGILINKRKIFRVAGHWTAHFAFLGMILAIVLLAKAGRII